MKEDIKNINTLSNEVLELFSQVVYGQVKLDLHVSPDYTRGFNDGVNCLQKAFLKAMGDGRLNYRHCETK